MPLPPLAIWFSANTPADDFLDTSLWSMMEIYVSIICVCMPSLKLGLQRSFPKILRSIYVLNPKDTGLGRSESSTKHGSVVELVELVGVAMSIETHEESHGGIHNIRHGQTPE